MFSNPYRFFLIFFKKVDILNVKLFNLLHVTSFQMGVDSRYCQSSQLFVRVPSKQFIFTQYLVVNRAIFWNVFLSYILAFGISFKRNICNQIDNTQCLYFNIVFFFKECPHYLYADLVFPQHLSQASA